MTWLLYIFAVLYAITSNRHFGGNLLPHTDAELIADGIGLLLFGVAVLASTVEENSRQGIN